jgi:hypothetical protein
MSLIPSLNPPPLNQHDCEIALGQRLKALKELMLHQNEEIETLTSLAFKHKEKADKVKEYILPEVETTQYFMNVE